MNGCTQLPMLYPLVTTTEYGVKYLAESYFANAMNAEIEPWLSNHEIGDLLTAAARHPETPTSVIAISQKCMRFTAPCDAASKPLSPTISKISDAVSLGYIHNYFFF